MLLHTTDAIHAPVARIKITKAGDKQVARELLGCTPYLRIFVFSTPDVGAGPHAVVGVVARWLIYPLPAEVFPEVDV